MTVLFADLSGFTSLAERLDPEEVRAFQTTLFEALGQAISRYDGFVAKFLGDAALAFLALRWRMRMIPRGLSMLHSTCWPAARS